MKFRLFKFILLSLLMLTVTSCENFGGKYTPKFFRGKKSETILYVVHADVGQVQVQQGDTNEGQLLLQQVDQSVSYFEGNSKTEAGSKSMVAFLNDWGQETSSETNPKATMSYYRKNTNQNAFEEVNLVLMNPEYNSGSNELTFEYQVQENTMIPMGDLSDITLFIELPSSSS